MSLPQAIWRITMLPNQIRLTHVSKTDKNAQKKIVCPAAFQKITLVYKEKEIDAWPSN